MPRQYKQIHFVLGKIIYTKVTTIDTLKDCQENILIFTDGSKNEIGQTGYGITFSEEEVNAISEPLPSYSSIFQAEAIAVWQASKKQTTLIYQILT